MTRGFFAGTFGALVALVAMSSCQQSTGQDGYRFERREFDRATVTVTKVEHPTVAALRIAAADAKVWVEADRELQAFGFVERGGTGCTIHFVKPENDAAVRLWIGHEIAHCFYGRWHS